MIEIISVDIIDNDQGGHKDLLFSIPDLVGNREFDTYYLALAIEPDDSISDIKRAAGQLLQFWKNKIQATKNGETIYLPIDFSDQYTGCLRVDKRDKKLSLTYGFSRREGYAVNPLNPDDYYKSIKDFEADSNKQLTIEENDFIENLDRIIIKFNS